MERTMSVAEPPAPLPDVFKPLPDVVGDAASANALGRLTRDLAQANRATTAKAKRKSVELLRSALAAIRAHDYQRAADKTLAALEADEKSGLAWHLLAISQEKLQNYSHALTAYEAALKLLPDEAEIAADLGRLAQRLSYHEIAEKLLLKALARSPGNVEVTNNLACVQRDRGNYAEAIETVRSLLTIEPSTPLLWNTLGTILTDQGEMAQSITFFDEALRLEPTFSKALYNRANARQSLGDSVQALADIELALEGITEPSEVNTVLMAKAMTQIFVGNLREGFETYEVRFSRTLNSSVHFVTNARRWQPEDDISGARMLVFGEQGLGDEVMFFSIVPELLDAIGIDGELTLAVERRLMPLIQRSFPKAIVVPHHSVSFEGRLARRAVFDGDTPKHDLWAPIGSLYRRFRPDIASFANPRPYLKPAPERVEHWRKLLDEAAPGPKVGVVWKSLVMDGMRARYFSAFDLWKPVLSVPGVTFVNLQYGDVSVEMEKARAAGVPLWSPPGIDLKDDLDDVAALAAALDLVLGQPNATTNIAAASGARWWGLATPDDWTCFGTDTYPIYRDARAFFAEGFGQWDSVMSRLADEVTGWAATGPRNAA